MIPLIDLKAQYYSIKDEIDKAVFEVISSGQFILGENVKALEKEIASYCGAQYAIGVASGTDALLLSLLALGIGRGDKVITTPFTFIATAEAVSHTGATPIFIDIDPLTYNIDPFHIEETIDSQTKAIIPVHLYGQPADMDKIMEIAKRYDLLVVEDCAQATGAEYKGRKVGSFGNAGCLSFFPSKNLGAYGDGGIVLTNNSDTAEKIRMLRTHGSKEKYYHSLLGFNSRLDELQAAILRVKLKYLDQWIAERQHNAEIYNQMLTDLPLVTPHVAKDRIHTYNLYTIRSQERNLFQEKLRENQVSSAIYYPLPLHLQKIYTSLGYRTNSLPESKKASQEVLSLPIYPELRYEDIEYITTIVKRIL